MRSRSTPATAREASQIWGRPTQVPTLCENGTLWQLSRSRADNALRFPRPASMKAIALAAGRQVLSLLSLR